MEKTNVFRFKFSDDIVQELHNFSKIHKFETRQDYKESWEAWVKTNKEMIDTEEERLVNAGYKGNILDKMYKSARYYFAKKSNQKQESKKRRAYISIPKNILAMMDEHIATEVMSPKYKPAIGFKDFMEVHYYDVNNVIDKLHNDMAMDHEDIQSKFKKTYKNRYFIYKQKIISDRKSDDRKDEDDIGSVVSSTSSKKSKSSTGSKKKIYKLKIKVDA